MGINTTCTASERIWRLRVRGKLTKRQQTELRLALYWINGLPVEQKEKLVNGAELRLTVVDAVISVIQLAAPRVPLDVKLVSDEPRRLVPLHIDAIQTVKETTDATH
jgi:hypothetical protein